ncbi:MAG: prolyl oligopeptidase family serine peptidase [Actinomycetes bacterium]
MDPFPPTARTDTVYALHGCEVADPYQWLEDRSDPATLVWLTEQAMYFIGQRSQWSTVSYWRSRLEALLGAGVVGPPVWRGSRCFQMRRNPGQEHAVLWVIDSDGSERALIDPIDIDPSGLTTLDAWQPTKEGDRIAYQVSAGGTEESMLLVMDVATGEHLEGPIGRVRYSPIAWLPGGQAYYYVRRLPPEQVPTGEEQFHRRVWLHIVGTDPTTDVLIFGDGRKKTEYFGVSVSRDGRWLSISASEGTAPRNDVWVADLQTIDGETGGPGNPRLTAIQEGIDCQSGLHFGRHGRVYAFTDRDAQRGRVAVTTTDALGVESWRDLIPQDDVAVLEDFAILDGPELDKPIMLVSWTRHAIAHVTIHDLWTGERISELDLPGIGTIGGLLDRPEGGHEAWFVYTDNATVPRVMRYDAATDTLTVAAYPPGFVEVPPICSSMQTYRSKDGTEVRMLVLSRSQDTPDHPRPTILYGYGGFAIPMAPSYSPNILAWVEAGGVYAIACIRGGSEEGEGWHRAGMLANKQNVFDDFIAAAEWLIAQGWTTSSQLAISGGSNGGLLVGAVMTQRPDLMTAVHCSAPLLDMIRYESSGLGATWNVEYGSAASPEEFGWLAAYSPLHRVRDSVAYPATLFTVFDHDTRVDPMHARKMCAALQHATSGFAPIMIRAEMDVGHGARSVSRSVELSADVLAFLADETGLAKELVV